MNDLWVPGAATAKAAQLCEETWLLGLPPIAHFLDFIEEMVVGELPAKRALVDEWRAANDHYHELELAEAGVADEIECKALPKALSALADEVRADTRFETSFDTMPTSFEMVELERLVLFQHHVSRHHVERLKAALGPNPTPQALFRFCMPLGVSAAGIEVRRINGRRFSFTSDSLDFRSHDAVLLRPDQISGHRTFGAVGAVLAIPVGFSSNFLSAVRSDSRVILHNGYHRACALLELGIKRAPCIVETVTRRDELRLIAKSRVADDPTFYLESARPPVLRDFLDTKLRKTYRTRRIRRVVEIEIETHDHNVPE